MKKAISIIILLFFVVMGANAQGQTTTDRMTLNEVTLDIKHKDSTVYLEVGLDGENIYAAYSVDLTLPEGVRVAKDEDDDWDIFIYDTSLYPAKKGQLTAHLLSHSDDVVTNPIKIACLKSGDNAVFKSTQGSLFSVGLVPTDDAVAGEYEVKLSAVYLINDDAVRYKAPDTTAKLVVTNTTGISEASCANKTTSSVYSLEGMKVKAPQKGHLYVVDGKKMKY